MSQITKVVIFGATGNTGLCCVKAALDLDLDVTAFVRDPSKLPGEFSSRVNVITGDVSDSYQVQSAVQGQDGVVIALGTRNDLSPTTLLSEGTENIVSAMKMYGVNRVSACMSAFVLMDRSRVPERFHPITDDHERMLDVVKSSGLDWVAVMPPHIADAPGQGDCMVAYDKTPGRVISKYDLGHFLVSSLSSDEHVHRVCGVCDKTKVGGGSGGGHACTLHE